MRLPGLYSAFAATLCVVCLCGFSGPSAHASRLVQHVAVRQAPAISMLNGFLPNRGQYPPEVLFFAQRGGIEATLLADALVFRPSVDPESKEPVPAPLVLRLPGAPRGGAVEGVGELPTLHHFILSSGSASNVRGFETVLYRDVQPGIDVRVRFDGERFAYDLLLDPGAELAGFEISVEGAQGVQLAEDQTLVLETAAGPVEQRIEESWHVQPETGARVPVAAKFRLIASTEECIRLGFEVPARDPRRALVIDPTLDWATYVGGPNQELLDGMALDDEGAVYLVCRASAGTTPTTPGSLMPLPTANGNLWVGKVSSGGTALEWATFLGGSESEQIGRIEVDTDGTVVVAGKTWSTDFPVTEGSLQTVHGGNGKADIFVSRLDPTGSSLVWSTFLGKTGSEEADALVLTPSGDVVVAGHYVSGSDPLPATPGAFDPVYDEGDRFVFRMSTDGSSLVFLTYLPAGVADLAIGEGPSIYLAGNLGAEGASILVTPGAFKETIVPGDPGDGYIARMNDGGGSIDWATLLGGDTENDFIEAIALDGAGAVYVTGMASSPDFPVTPGAFDDELTGGNGGFITKLLPNGSGLVWSTHLGPECACGGSGYASDIAVDAAGNAHVLGSANEPGWPTTPDAFQPLYAGPFPHGDAVLTKIDALGEALVYSTWFGGDGSDSKGNIALDALGRPHIALHTGSDDLPATPGAYQGSNAGSTDIVVAEFDVPLLPWRFLGGGLKGAEDEPNLAGTGALTPNSPTRLSVRGAFPSSIGWFFVGFTTIDLPFLGGTLIPWPNIYFSVPVDGNGAIDLPFSWPGLPPGSSLYFQYWVIDPGGPEFFAATGALRAISQAP